MRFALFFCAYLKSSSKLSLFAESLQEEVYGLSVGDVGDPYAVVDF